MSVEPKRNGASYSNSRRAEEYSAIESCALGWRVTGGGERQQTKRSFDSYTRTLSDDFRDGRAEDGYLPDEDVVGFELPHVGAEQKLHAMLQLLA